MGVEGEDAGGEPPLTYLTNWRLDLAADYLHEPAMKVAQVAGAVGYDNPFAFSNAFKRHTGLSPSDSRSRRLPALGGEGQMRDPM